VLGRGQLLIGIKGKMVILCIFLASLSLIQLNGGNKIGKKEFHLVFCAALLVLSLPASNTFLEYIFSACTWFDDPLR